MPVGLYPSEDSTPQVHPVAEPIKLECYTILYGL